MNSYLVPDIEITARVILLRISRLYDENMTQYDLYEATRGIWKVDRNRVERAEYAFAVADGIVREVYKIDSWYPAGTTKYHWREFTKIELVNRYEFTGRIADNEIRAKYLGRNVSDYFSQGNQNPVRYVNVPQCFE